MSATGESRATAIDCRARSSATAWDPTGSQRRRSRRISSVAAAVGAAPGRAGAGRLGAAVVAAAVVSAAAEVRAAAVRAVAVRAVALRLAAVVGRDNIEAKPICGRGFDR